jgi:hypothetical protein
MEYLGFARIENDNFINSSSSFEAGLDKVEPTP